LERPVRESAKNIAIEKGLKRAAENRNSLFRLKSGAKVAKKRPSIPSADQFLLSSPSYAGGGSSSGSKSAGFSSPGAATVDRNRTKKVYSTAKQRLGKILGLKF
jgi:hypothetical protein